MTPHQEIRRGGLTISEFGRRSGLSHKALRLYDLSGLLPPATVDPVNGYRFYSADQLRRARRISLLRQLEMPLAVVAEVLAGTDEEAVRRLDRWWAEQEAATTARRSAMEFLRERLTRAGDNALGTRPVTIRQVPRTKVAAIQRAVDQPALVGAIVTGTREIRGHLTAAGAEPAGESWVIYHGFVTPDSEGVVEVCVPFSGLVVARLIRSRRVSPSAAAIAIVVGAAPMLAHGYMILFRGTRLF